MTLLSQLDPAAYSLPDDLARRLQSPALVIWMDAVRHNVARVIEQCGTPDRWRPHVKTTKIPAVWDELLNAGLTRFKTSTTRETELLCRLLDGRDIPGDVLMAQPLVGPGLERLARIASDHPRQRLSVLVEDAARLVDVPAAVGVFVDVNSGMDRTGVPLERTAELIDLCRGAGARLAGVHCYDGHLHDADLDRRAAAIHAGYDDLLVLLGKLSTAGCVVNEVITAGTPAFTHALSHPGLSRLDGTRHTVSPGTVVFHDARTELENPGLGLRPAATVFTRVLSHPRPGRITCDAGHKAVSADAGDPCARVIGHPELVADTPSEEHLPLIVRSGASPARGSVLALVPEHVCPTVNLAERAVLIEPDRSWTVVEVAARAHELLLDD
jgi:D-serine deaminase-like pyridoxal phosphate-dependent protein